MGEDLKPSRVRRYAYVNNFRASQTLHKIALYVLMLNVADDVAPVPYHVGLSENLQLKLGRDQAVNWHFQTFGRPALVQVLGTVAEAQANDARDDLRSRLLAAGHRLMDDAQGVKFLHGSVPVVSRYARQQQVIPLTVDTGVVAISKINRRAESYDASKEPEVKGKPSHARGEVAAQPVRKADLRRLDVGGMSDEARALHMLLVKHFDEQSQQAVVTVFRAEGETREQADLNLLATCVELREIWRPRGGIPRTNRKQVFGVGNVIRKAADRTG